MRNNKITIESGKKRIRLNLNELLDYKDLFLILAKREYRIRYAQTFLGFFWALIQPLITLLIFIVIFGKGLKIGESTGEIPYPVFALAGMTAWIYFQYVVSQSGKSIINEQNVIKKIYFPRLIIPLSKAIVGLIDFGITFMLLIIFMIYYNVSISANIVWLPVFILIIIFSSLTVGIWLSALTIRFRDFQHVIPFLVQVGLYATPVAYPSNLVPEKYQLLYHIINPMVGVVEGFRWCMVGGDAPPNYIYYSFTFVIILFIGALYYFKKVERTMADII